MSLHCSDSWVSSKITRYCPITCMCVLLYILYSIYFIIVIVSTSDSPDLALLRITFPESHLFHDLIYTLLSTLLPRFLPPTLTSSTFHNQISTQLHPTTRWLALITWNISNLTGLQNVITCMNLQPKIWNAVPESHHWCFHRERTCRKTDFVLICSRIKYQCMNLQSCIFFFINDRLSCCFCSFKEH